MQRNSWIKEQITIKRNYSELIERNATQYQNLQDTIKVVLKSKSITFNGVFKVIK